MLARRAVVGTLAVALSLVAAAWAFAVPGTLDRLQGENVAPGIITVGAAPSVTSVPLATTTTVATATSTTSAPDDLGLRPIPIPPDSYAPEDIVEIGMMEIPAIGLVHRLQQGVTLNNIDRGPSHWPGTAMPGQPGNTVIAGHRVTNTRPFRNLDALVKGDEVIFNVAGIRSVYRVVDSLVVKPEEVWIAKQTPASTGTLYACHPPGSQAFRFVVRLELAA